MTLSNLIKSGVAAIAVAATFGSPAIAAPAASAKSANSANNGKVVVLSIGRGEQINLPVGVSDVVVSSPNIADVDVRSAMNDGLNGRNCRKNTCGNATRNHPTAKRWERRRCTGFNMKLLSFI